MCIFFFKQKTAYEIYQCDWSSDVCSSDLYHFLIMYLLSFPLIAVENLYADTVIISLVKVDFYY